MVCALIVGVPFVLIAKQPDFGTGVLVVASGAFALFLAGMQWWRILFVRGGRRQAIASVISS